MRKTSVSELHIPTSELVREAEDGGVIVIQRHGRPVAELHPFSAPPVDIEITPEKKAQIFAEMQEIWSTYPHTHDSTIAISEDRDR